MTLLILAAGLGSRYGGLKQLDPMTDAGNFIIDFSVYDAIRAGFDRVVFLIKLENEKIFRETIGSRIEKKIRVEYAFQDLDNLPSGLVLPAGRVKPWGTGHAVLACKDHIDSPFAVINADDYYGKNGFKKAAKFLETNPDGYALVGYILKNTLSDHGGVTRGICRVDQGSLAGIKETKNIVKTEAGAEVDGCGIDTESLVSMNFWCCPKSFIRVLQEGFPVFLEHMSDPLKDEYLLPIIADQMLKEGTDFSVLPTDDHWFGVTYKEDKPAVEEAFRKLIEAGEYSADLYSDLV